MQQGVLSNTKGFAANDAGDECAVIETVETEIRIGWRSCEIVNGCRACAEFLLSEPNAGIYDIHVHAGADAVVMMGAVQWQVDLIDPVEAPKSKLVSHYWLLHAGQNNLTSLFNIFDSRIAAQRDRLRL